LTPNKKTQPIQWTEWPTGALVAEPTNWCIGGCWFTLVLPWAHGAVPQL